MKKGRRKKDVSKERGRKQKVRRGRRSEESEVEKERIILKKKAS